MRPLHTYSNRTFQGCKRITPHIEGVMRSESWQPFTGDCPDFRGVRGVVLGKCLTAAKMGLSPLASREGDRSPLIRGRTVAVGAPRERDHWSRLCNTGIRQETPTAGFLRRLPRHLPVPTLSTETLPLRPPRLPPQTAPRGRLTGSDRAGTAHSCPAGSSRDRKCTRSAAPAPSCRAGSER
jgi:hypothetical protein